MLTVLLALSGWVSVASAGELETWVGGGASVSGFANTDGAGLDPLGTQLELDAAIGWQGGHARLDLDLHIDPSGEAGCSGDGSLTDVILPYPGSYCGSGPIPLPEWAMVQLGREAKHLRLGLFSPNLGIEDWDPWMNYVSTYSINYNFAGPGRFLGAEGSITTESGYDLFAWAGIDADYGTPGAGVGVATEQDAFSTWSGAFVYPVFSTNCPGGEATCLFTGASIAAEVYPLDGFLWVGLDSVTGVKGGQFFSSNHVVVNIAPEAVVNPYVRVEGVFDPGGALGPDAPDAGATVGVRSDITDWLRVSAEGTSSFYGSEPVLGGALMIAAHAPEPSPYSYQDPFEIEE